MPSECRQRNARPRISLGLCPARDRDSTAAAYCPVCSREAGGRVRHEHDAPADATRVERPGGRVELFSVHPTELDVAEALVLGLSAGDRQHLLDEVDAQHVAGRPDLFGGGNGRLAAATRDVEDALPHAYGCRGEHSLGQDAEVPSERVVVSTPARGHPGPALVLAVLERSGADIRHDDLLGLKGTLRPSRRTKRLNARLNRVSVKAWAGRSCASVCSARCRFSTTAIRSSFPRRRRRARCSGTSSRPGVCIRASDCAISFGTHRMIRALSSPAPYGNSAPWPTPPAPHPPSLPPIPSRSTLTARRSMVFRCARSSRAESAQRLSTRSGRRRGSSAAICSRVST